jgi:outer membrane protein TolC
LKYDQQQISIQKKALLTAKSSLEFARVSYTEGNVGSLEVLDAERSYNQARLGYVRARAKQFNDTIQLYLVLGGGLINKTIH